MGSAFLTRYPGFGCSKSRLFRPNIPIHGLHLKVSPFTFVSLFKRKGELRIEF